MTRPPMLRTPDVQSDAHAAKTRSFFRGVTYTDRRLAAMARETAEQIDWEELSTTVPKRWKWHGNAGDFALFTRDNAKSHFAILGVGVVSCSVPELLRLMEASTQEEHSQKLEDLYGEDFREGSFVHNVRLEGSSDNNLSVDAQDIDQLSVKTVTFNKTGWLSTLEELCYVDAIYYSEHHQPDRQAFGKVMTSVHPREVTVGKSNRPVKFLDDVCIAYDVQPDQQQIRKSTTGSNQDQNDDSPKERPSFNGANIRRGSRSSTNRPAARVRFYAEHARRKQSHFSIPLGRSCASDEAIHSRLLRMAESCGRFALLIRRRRLGAQVLVDRHRILPPTNTRCIACDKSLLIAKLCRLCGQGVCVDCSSKHEREQFRPRMTRRSEDTTDSDELDRRIHLVRVCKRCLERVDRADYSLLTSSSLSRPCVVPDSPTSSSSPQVLTELLQDALRTAESPKKKASVMNVIKCIMDQDLDSVSSTTSSMSSASTDSGLIAPTRSELDELAFIGDYLCLNPLPMEDCVVANEDERSYRMDPGDPHEKTPYPVPDRDDERVRAATDSLIREFGPVEELDLICKLAAKEAGCMASMISVIGQDDLYVAASSDPSFNFQTFPRDGAFCAHTIMDTKPLILRHPESDVRFHESVPVKALGVQYYCGFPLRNSDDFVIGTMCCMDQTSREITQSQYTTLKRLADTASKVVTIQTTQRRKLSEV